MTAVFSSTALSAAARARGRKSPAEVITLIKKDPHVKSLPVMIVSYKDRAEDRRRGPEAGSDYYLAKGGFHDETLLNAVVDLIGGGRP